ncbi:MAG: glycine--tRNA ligase subunit beta [Oceanospirillaceae bacterium]|uniref:glycine--tRNA ligase subunit beta n=1 Tax=unclassified Thalassolituus TaxID=2624967 RepID=UPI000C0B8AD5|nr:MULTISPECIES: glycine--tRNA ligase subunit beta [unclassified Thalassolituus]MAK90826.1 glycine--tRNA ligase subunit beta [Thalassolituus sp.]MAS25019.1 glycine--tRNA ligase subunit beta [Oceanospirillaceae bacterium]MAX98561.1 glycine--tRNA ligase subunit beta [Oceanospirillaceae bacterium]MBS51855.1 glycine--tRNA ligase subunit beta [Oceanospirillaceae bacterium]|tara:strand:+ start:3594 stop:5663 length:2070 start_codon:yes stop_codon:yes gene_type:complete
MSRDLLIELGTEELPPTALKNLSAAFTQGIEDGLKEAGLSFADVVSFAAPRRLAVRINALEEQQADKEETLYGPPAKIAFDADGKPTKAAIGFAERAGADAAQLETAPESHGKNAGKLMLNRVIKGKQTTELLGDIVQNSLDKLPIPKRMRWGASRVEFVRPVHWLIMLFGNDVVDAEVLGLKAGNTTRGHRFHAPGEITISAPDEYESKLREAYVMADFAERSALIKGQVEAEGKKLGGEAVIDDDLLNEVTALNEWPVALAGSFDEDFLRVPQEALVSSMKEHQKYFHVMKDGKLLPNFITIANIESKDPSQVISGNEKVIRPRLADAAFFWDTDRKHPLASRFPKLENVVWVNGLGSVADKTRRISALATKIAEQLGADKVLVQRAAHLCKNDLVSNMVFEFTDLQGLAGKYYAEHDGEPEEVCAAMIEQYMPAFAGDALPQTQTGTLIALADRLDSLAGLFGTGQIPTGSKDPFALRRASLGVLRLLVEKEINIDLGTLIDWALANDWETDLKSDTKAVLTEYMLDRFSAWYHDEGIPAEVFQAVRTLGITNALDVNRRVQAVHEFSKLESAEALAAANKRVSNILAKNNGDAVSADVDASLFEAAEEKALFEQMTGLKDLIIPSLEKGNYSMALEALSTLRKVVDDFFDNVMVISDNEAVKNNRLALLKQLRAMFMGIADISVL